MYFYFLIFLIYLVLYKIYGNKKGVAIILFSSLLFLYTFRDISVGWDTETYVNIFKNYNQGGNSYSYLESGWLFLNRVVYKISSNYHFLFFVVGLISLSCYFAVAKRISSNLCLAVLFYFSLCYYFRLMNTQRCDLAVCICMVSFYFLYKKKYVVAILLTLFAFLFHKSALVFGLFILFDIIVKKFNRKTILFLVVSVLTVFIFYDSIFSFLTQFAYGGYLDKTDESKGGSLRFFFIYLIIFVIALLLDKNNVDKLIKNSNDDKERLNKLLFFAILFGLSFQLISLNNSMIARFSNYFTIYFPIVLSNSFSACKSWKGRPLLYKMSIFIVIAAFMIINLYFSENGMGKDNVLPYIINFN